MIDALQVFFMPLIAAGFTLWAAWLAFAAEADAELPRLIARELRTREEPLSGARSLHLAHLALLILAGVTASTATFWWSRPPLRGLAHLIATVGLVWVTADLLPRMLASIAPELSAPIRRAALRSLLPFRPLRGLIAWADARVMPVSAAPRPDLGGTQRDMLFGVFSLAEMTVAEVMTPRIDIIAVDASASRDEVIATLQNSEHARILVFERHADAVSGVVYAKDMLASLEGGGDESWHSLIRAASFVPEGKTLDRQLRDFQRGPSHLAVVVDEFGGTAGLVTLEDILEQIVGEIQDERDTEEVVPIQQLADDHFRVQGGVPLSELEEALGHRFGREDVSTVGGLVLAVFGRVPRAGESVDVDGIRLSVEQVTRRRVRRVDVSRIPALLDAEEVVERDA